MREVVARIHPIGIHRAQVLDLELDQRPSQLSLVSQALREIVRLELVSTGKDIHQELDDGVHWSEGIREENEADDDWELLVEAERLVERLVVDEDREEGEDVEEMCLKKVNK